MSKLFFKQFLNNKKMVGSITPSSKFLCAKMLNNIPLKSAKLIIELGPGTGCFTEKIVEKMGSNTQLIVVELNSDFHQHLKDKIIHSNVHIKQDSANNIGILTKQLGFEKADIIISSLPLANFPPELRNLILKSVNENLTDNGSFVQFQYSLNAYKNLKKIFHSVNLQFTALNFPPAFVYTCKKS